MGYFASTAEGDNYRAQWCERCRHDVIGGCPLWLAQLEANDDQDHVLNSLIPRSADGLQNEMCRMFIKRVELTGQHYKVDEP